MGYTTRISDYEWDRGDGAKEVPEGVEVSAVTKSKVVEPEDNPEPKKTTARSKAK